MMKKLVNKEELKNKIYPYILTFLVLFWTIASVLGIISFVKGQCKDNGIITASAADSTIDVSNQTFVFDQNISFGNVFIIDVNFVSNGQTFTEISADVEGLYYNNTFVCDNNSTFVNAAYRTITFGSDVYLSLRNYNWLYGNTGNRAYVNVSGQSFVFNEVLESRPSTITFYDVNGIALNSNIGNVRNLDNTVTINADTIKSISIPSQTGLPGTEYILTFSNTMETARYNFVIDKWGFYDGIRFNEVDALTYRRIQFNNNVYMKRYDYTWLEDNTMLESYGLGYDVGLEDGYVDGYDDGYEAGYADLLNKLTKLREGMLSFATSANWANAAPLYSSDFFPFIAFGEFDLGSTYRDTFEDYTEIYTGRTSYITFFFDSSDKFTLDLINFSVKYQGPTTINGTYAINNLRVTLDNGYITNLPFVLSSSSDEMFPNQGYFDTSNLSLNLNNYIVSLRFECMISNSTFEDGANLLNYIIVDNNAIDSSAYELGFETGYSKANVDLKPQLDVEYRRGYALGNRDGYDTGFTAGVSQANNYSFAGLLSAVIDVPVSTFRSLFNFELLGVNLSSFFFTILTILIILAVIKLLL